MRYLKQSTQVVQMVGPFLDKTDGVTEEAGLAGVGTEISKEPGAAFGAGPVLGTYDSDGWYPVTLTTTHTNTIGALVIKVHDAATHLPVWHEFHVLAANVYDSLFGAATDKLEVDVQEINSGAGAADNLKTAADAYSATRGLAGTAVPAAAAGAAGGIPLSTAGGLDLDAKLANTNEVTAARMSELDAGTGGKMAAEVDLIKTDAAAILADTGTDGVVVAAGAKTGYALTSAYDPAKTAAQAGDAMALTSGERTTLAAAIWNALTSGMSTVGSIGKKLADWAIHSAADVWSSATRTLTAATNITSTGGTTVPQTGDSFARIGATGSGLTSLATQVSVDDLPTNAELATALGTADDAVLAAIAALNNLSAAQVNAEMVDVLRTDTGTEVSAVPAAAAAIAAQIQFLFQALRNKVTVSATAKTISNDAGTTVGTKTLSDDGTTYQEGEMA